MTVASLFAGIGGFDLALTRQGHDIVYANEWDRYAADIYDHHFDRPTDRRDITTVRATELPDFDLLCGGFPCQAFSVSGKRRGFDDTRGTLFFDIARILEGKRPRYLLLENVKGLLSHDGGNTIHTIIATLDDLGYDLQWQVLNSKDFGVPQNRERIFIVGHLRGESRPEVFPLAPADGKNIGVTENWSRGYRDYDPSHLDEPHIIARNQRSEVRATNYTGTINADRSAKQFQYVVEPKAVVGQDDVEDTAVTISRGFEGRMTVWRGMSTALRDFGSGGNKMPMVVQGASLRGRCDGPKLEIRDDGLTNALRTAGGGSSKSLVAYPGHTINSLDRPANTLKAGVHGVPGGEGLVQTDLRIRRLTPTECERLQGFPDGWTARGVNGPISDTQRYKCLGNAVTVNVVEGIVQHFPS